MEENHYHHDLGLGHPAAAVVLALSDWLDGVFCHHGIKNFAKVIRNTENFSNFVIGNHSDLFSFFWFSGDYKFTDNFANYQIYKGLYFAELTLN